MSDEQTRPSPLVVVLAGLLTTAATLAAVWWLDTHTKDFHVMGWYADYVLPVGAAMVGVAAGVGYGVASWWTGLKIRRGLLGVVMLCQLGGYAAAEWVEYRGELADALAEQEAEGVPAEERDVPMTFVEYFHLRATNFRWDNHGKPGNPLGMWGYLFVGLAVVGFVGGGLVIPGVMMFKPYCDDCTRYMRTRQLGILPASAPFRKVSKKDPADQLAFAEENARAAEVLKTKLDRISDLAAKQDGYGLRQELPAQTMGERRQVSKLPARLAVSLIHCPGCRKAHLQPTRITGQGKQIKQTKLEILKAGPEVVRAFVE